MLVWRWNPLVWKQTVTVPSIRDPEPSADGPHLAFSHCSRGDKVSNDLTAYYSKKEQTPLLCRSIITVLADISSRWLSPKASDGPFFFSVLDRAGVQARPLLGEILSSLTLLALRLVHWEFVLDNRGASFPSARFPINGCFMSSSNSFQKENRVLTEPCTAPWPAPGQALHWSSMQSPFAWPFFPPSMCASVY